MLILLLDTASSVICFFQDFDPGQEPVTQGAKAHILDEKIV